MKKQEYLLIGYMQALYEVANMYYDNFYNGETPKTAEEARRLLVGILDDRRKHSAIKLGQITSKNHPIWTD